MRARASNANSFQNYASSIPAVIAACRGTMSRVCTLHKLSGRSRPRLNAASATPGRRLSIGSSERSQPHLSAQVSYQVCHMLPSLSSTFGFRPLLLFFRRVPFSFPRSRAMTKFAESEKRCISQFSINHYLYFLRVRRMWAIVGPFALGNY